MDVNEKIHEQLKKAGVALAASLPDDWVAPLINRIAADNTIRHVRVAREADRKSTRLNSSHSSPSRMPSSA